jgi:hypothetical protein
LKVLYELVVGSDQFATLPFRQSYIKAIVDADAHGGGNLIGAGSRGRLG